MKSRRSLTDCRLRRLQGRRTLTLREQSPAYASSPIKGATFNPADSQFNIRLYEVRSTKTIPFKEMNNADN